MCICNVPYMQIQHECKLEINVEEYVEASVRPYLMDVIYCWSKVTFAKIWMKYLCCNALVHRRKPTVCFIYSLLYLFLQSWFCFYSLESTVNSFCLLKYPGSLLHQYQVYALFIWFYCFICLQHLNWSYPQFILVL